MAEKKDPYGTGLKIEKLYAFVADDAEDEGVCGFVGPDGRWMAMVAADKVRVESLKLIVRDIARQTGRPINLLCFSVREQIESILPYTYTISGNSITCLICGRTSFNRNDVKNKYCGHCKHFHED